MSDIPSPLPVPQRGSIGRSQVKDYLEFAQPSPPGCMVHMGRQRDLHLLKRSRGLFRSWQAICWGSLLCIAALFCTLKLFVDLNEKESK